LAREPGSIFCQDVEEGWIPAFGLGQDDKESAQKGAAKMSGSNRCRLNISDAVRLGASFENGASIMAPASWRQHHGASIIELLES